MNRCVFVMITYANSLAESIHQGLHCLSFYLFYLHTQPVSRAGARALGSAHVQNEQPVARRELALNKNKGIV